MLGESKLCLFCLSWIVALFRITKIWFFLSVFGRDKKKEFAANHAAYIPFGVDVFLSPRKIDHIARFVELPSVDSHGEVPPLLVVNLQVYISIVRVWNYICHSRIEFEMICGLLTRGGIILPSQIPLYPAAFFQNENDGPGMNFVIYCKLSENYADDLPLHFRENIKVRRRHLRFSNKQISWKQKAESYFLICVEQKIIANETEKIKGFAIDTNAPYRERLKILGRVMNVDDLQLSSAERKLMHAYNEKPVLSRPQHEFYLVKFRFFFGWLNLGGVYSVIWI